MLTTRRIFTDYDHFDSEYLLCSMGLAKALEWLYDEDYFPVKGEKASNVNRKYFMNDCLLLYDLMSLAVLFVSLGRDDDLPEAKIKGAINGMESGREGTDGEEAATIVEYEGEELRVGNLEPWTTDVVLWAAFVYCEARCLLYEANDTEEVKYHQARKVLLKVFRQHSGCNQESLEKHFLMRHNKAATSMITNEIVHSVPQAELYISEDQAVLMTVKNAGKGLLAGGLQESEEQLRTRIAELEEELRLLKEEYEAYKERQQNRVGINGRQTAQLGIRLAPLLGIEVKNKKVLAQPLSKLFGWGARKMEQNMSAVPQEEEMQELADIFEELSPELAQLFIKKRNAHAHAKDEAAADATEP